MEGKKQLFRQWARLNGYVLGVPRDNQLQVSEVYLITDDASPHYISRNVRCYYDKHKDAFIPVFPTTFSEFMVRRYGI